MKKLLLFLILALCAPCLYAANIAPMHGKATANSSYLNRLPANATDGDPEIIWNASRHGTVTNPVWLIVDLQSSFTVSEVTLKSPDIDGRLLGYTNSYKLSVSTDGINWTLVAEGTLYDSTDPEEYADMITIPAELSPLQYVKYEVIGGTHWAHLGEMEIEGVLYEEPQAQNYPVIIIPGIFGSWSTEMFCGNEDVVSRIEWALRRASRKNSDIISTIIPNQWTLDPITGTYDSLHTYLEGEGFTVIDFGYDWRRHNEVSAGELTQFIADAKEQYGVDKVNIVAHSMGGLVARAHVQYSYRNDVDKFIMIGTPNDGAVDAHYTWEGGDFAKLEHKLPPFVMERILGQMNFGCAGFSGTRDPNFVHDFIPSVKELLPNFDYFLRKKKGKNKFRTVPVENMCGHNNFLDTLNQTSNSLTESGADIFLIAGSDISTLEYLKTKKRKKCKRTKWPDGKLMKLQKMIKDLDGDGTVLVRSVFTDIPAFLTVEKAIIDVTNHNDLMRSVEVHKLVVDFLRK